MRQFARRGRGTLGRLSVEARLAYSGFCVFMLLGYLTSLWFYEADRFGTSGKQVAVYYLGGADGESVAQATPGPGGPALELPPDDADAPPLHLEKPLRQVMETLHFHLFSVALCLLVVAHIFMMCGLPGPLKAGTIALGYVATLLHLMVPPLVRVVGAGWGCLMFPSALAMGLTWLLMTLWPLWEMWGRQPSSRPA